MEPDVPPETLRDGRYAFVRVLGEGSQGSTFEAVDKKVGRLVAIKRFRVRGAKSWKEVELAEREARVLASLEHPAIPRYVDHFEEGGELFLVMEKVEGTSLSELQKQSRPFGEADVIALLRDASAALDYLHGCAPPVVHRDIKPSNVFQRPDGSFALIDFGSVRDRMKLQGGSTVVGTFGYMAPEQFQGRAMPASDVYAVGATALTVLTGVEPEALPHRGLAIDVPAALKGTRVSEGLRRVLAAMLEPDPDRRARRIAPLLAEYDTSRGTRPREEAPRRRVSESPRAARKEGRAAERVARREGRRQRRGARMRRRAGYIPPPVAAILILGLTIARIAVYVALRIAVPFVLTLLSLVFGRPLRDAAKDVSRAGESAVRAIDQAREFIHRPPEDDEYVRFDGAQAPDGEVMDALRRTLGGRDTTDAPGARARIHVKDVTADEEEARSAEEEAAAEEEARAEARRAGRRWW